MLALIVVFFSAGLAGLLHGVDAQDFACGDANGVAGRGPGAYPWAVVVYHERLSNELPCMGTLITPRIVLIAATCFGSDRNKPDNLKVLLGKDVNNDTLVIGLKTNLAHPKLVNVSDVIVHPTISQEYANFHDIALLGLSESAQISADTMPACVQWQGNDDFPDGALIHSSGWSRRGNVEQAVHQEGTKRTFCGTEGNLGSCENYCARSASEVSTDTQQAEYHVIATVIYRANGAVAPACLPEYTHIITKYYEQLNQILSQRCSALNVNMNVSFIGERPQLLEDNLVQINFSLVVIPADRQPQLYDLCGSTLNLIFDLSVPYASAVIDPLINVSAIGNQCPPIRAFKSSIGRGFTCNVGEVLDMDTNQVPRCYELWVHYKSFGAGATVIRDNKHFLVGLFTQQNQSYYCYLNPEIPSVMGWIREQKDSLERTFKSM